MGPAYSGRNGPAPGHSARGPPYPGQDAHRRPPCGRPSPIRRARLSTAFPKR